jgi:hypothetical protein
MKMAHGLKTQVLKLSLILLIFLSIGVEAKTLKVDTITPSVTDGDLVLLENGTGDIKIGTASGFLKLVSGIVTPQTFIDLTADISGVLPTANGGTGSSSTAYADLTTNVNGILPIANGGTGSATQNFVDLTTAQTVAGEKTFSSNILMSGTGAIQIAVGTEAQRPTPAKGMLRFNDDSGSAEIYDGTAWVPVGSGGGGSLDAFYTENFESDVNAASFTTGNNATFNNSGTIDGAISDDTTTQIAGDTSLKYVMGASSANDWIMSPNITLDSKQKGQTIGIELYYTYNGDDDDIKIVAYDNTNTEVLSLSTNFIKASSTPQRLSVQFPTNTDTATLNWGYQVVTGNSGKIFIVDDIQISTNPYVSKDFSNDTDWANYTPTISGMGTVTNVDFRWKQEGVNYIIQGTFDAGTPTAAEAQIALPGSKTILSDLSIIQMAGSVIRDNTSTEHFHILITAGDSFMNIGSTASAGLVPKIGTNLVGTGNTMAFTAIVPIEGLQSSSEHIVTYNSRNAENSMVRLHTGNGHGSTNTKIRRFSTTVTSTGNAITYADSSTDGASFTINEDGVYYVSYTDIDTASIANFGVSLNSTQLTTSINLITATDRLAISNTSAANFKYSASWAGILNKDDIVRAHTDANGSASALVSFTISKIGVGDLLGVPVPRTAYIKDVKAPAANGGTFTSGAWQTRDLNTLSGDTEFVSLSSNQFTLQAGKYHISATMPAYKVNSNKGKLYNITDSVDEIFSSTSYTPSADTTQNNAVLEGSIEITATKTFEIRHECQTTQATYGFGVGQAAMGNEIYTQVKITKVSN